MLDEQFTAYGSGRKMKWNILTPFFANLKELSISLME